MPRPPDPSEDTDAAASFAPLRPRLVRLAYRMLGSLTDAEDVVQDAYLRWHRTDRAGVRDAPAYLSRTVTRLCLDQMKSARARRESYVGEWLPEPLVETEDEPGEDDLTLTLMLALERLSPLERAAFLLHDVFGQSFDDIASTLGRDAAACRQLAVRARSHVREARPRFPVSEARGEAIAAAFFDASRSGDVAALKAMLAEDVMFTSDGGGKRLAVYNVLNGAAKILRLFAGLARKQPPGSSRLVALRRIDGLPGLVTLEPDGLLQTTALQIEDDRIRAIYVMRNPDKLARLGRSFADAARH